MTFSTKNSAGSIVCLENDTSQNFLKQKIFELFNLEDVVINNIYDLFKIGRSVAGEDGKYLGTRLNENSPYTWISYGDFDKMCLSCAAGMTTLGIEFGDNVKIAAFCRMSPEVYSLIMAASIRRNVIVPLYDTLGRESIDHIADQAEPRVIFCDREKYFETITSTPLRGATHIFVTFMITHELQCKADERGLILLSFADLLKLGDAAEDSPQLEGNSLEDLLYIMYTSGSTGVPKGVELTQGNLVSNVVATSIHVLCGKEAIEVGGMTYYSYLPFQHSLETLVLLLITTCGGKIGISMGNIKMIMSDLKEVKPTLLVVVPRVLDRFREKILAKVESAGFLSRFLFNWNLGRRQNLLKSGGHYEQSLIDRFIFGDIHAGFGSNLRYLISGGAPLSRDLDIFSRVVFGANMMQGYGLTETAAATVVQTVGFCGLDNCGIPLPGVELKLVDVPELGYFASEGFGEVCIRGPNVTRGYYKRPDLGREAFDAEGFLRSGDVGRLNENGTVTIIDRSKNIFKLSQGEYIMTEKIEKIYSRHPLVSQIMVYGESTRDHIVGVVVVRRGPFVRFAEEIVGSGHEEGDLLESRVVKERFLAELTKLGKSAELLGFEQVKGLVLDFTEFTTENELLTPTLKIRRPQVTKLFHDRLRSLYDE